MLKHFHTQMQSAQTEGAMIRWVPIYDFITNVLSFGQVKRLRNLTIELAQLKPGENILDVGCGTGGVTIPAKLRVGSAGRVAGIDPSASMIAAAKRKSKRKGLDIDFRVGVIEALPFLSESFDVVTASLMMHHLPRNLRTKGAAEIYRVLKPGGRLLIADLIRPKTFAGFGALLIVLVHHGWPFDGEELPNLLKESGFEDPIQLEKRLSAVGFVQGTKA